MASLQRMVDIVFRGDNQLGSSIRSVESAIDAVADEADEAALNLDRAARDANELGDSAFSVDKLTLAMKALAASAVVREFVRTNAELETLQRTLEVVAGSADAAAIELDFIREITDELGLDFLTTAEAFASFSAATKNTALEGQQTRDIFVAFAGAMANLGRSTADTEGVFKALEQIVSKNTVSAEELRQQLGERLPGAFQLAADSIGVTTEELNQLLVRGELVAKDLLPGLAREVDSSLGPDGRISTFTGEVRRLGNAFVDLSIAAGDSGAFDTLNFLISGFTESVRFGVKELKAFQDGWEELRESVSQGLFTGGNVEKAFGFLDEALKSPFDRITDFGGKRFLDGVDLLQSFFDDFEEESKGGQQAAKQFADSLQEIEVTASRILIPLDDIGVGLSKTGDEGEKAAGKVSKAETALEKIASNERLRQFEAKIDLDIASLEADTDRAVSIFNGLNTTIESTGNLLGSLFDDRLNADSWEERRILERQINQEQENRETSLKKQNKLLDEQAKYFRARTDALRRGDALITVSGDGLQPHLEAMFMEMLEFVQVRVNAEGGELLLGL